VDVPSLDSPLELGYDDGSSESQLAWSGAGGLFAVRFSPPFNEYQITKAKVYFGALNNSSDPIRIHVLDSDKQDLIAPIDLTVTQDQEKTWIEVDLCSENLVRSGDFYIAEEQMVAGDPDIGTDLSSPPQGRSWQAPTWGYWQFMDDRNYMIRAEVDSMIYRVFLPRILPNH